MKLNFAEIGIGKIGLGPPPPPPDFELNKISFSHSIEEDYRQTRLSSPSVEVDSFLQQQAEKTLVTPDNFDSIIDQ